MTKNDLEKLIAEKEAELEKEIAVFNECDEEISKLLEKKNQSPKTKTNEPEKISIDEQIEKAKKRIFADTNKKVDAEIAKIRKEQEDSDRQKERENQKEPEKEFQEEDLKKTREEYAEGFKKFMAERKKKSNFLVNWGRKIFGSKVKEKELTEDVKNLEEEYNKNLVAFGNKMFADKKSELEKSGATKEAIESQLEVFKKIDIFNKIIIEEQNNLNKLKAENLPPKEKNIFRKGVDWYLRQNPWTRRAISFAITTPIFAFFTPGAIAAAGGIASYIAIKLARGAAGGLMVQGVSKLYDIIFKEKRIAEKREKEKNILSEKFTLADKELDLEKIKSYKKEYPNILETEQKRRRNRLIKKSLIAAAFGGATSLGTTELVHALTPEQVLSGQALPEQITKPSVSVREIINPENPQETPTTQPNIPTENQSGIDDNTAPDQTSPVNTENNTAPVQTNPETDNNTAPTQTNPDIEKSTGDNTAPIQTNPDATNNQQIQTPQNTEGYTTVLRPGEVEENGEVYGSNSGQTENTQVINPDQEAVNSQDISTENQTNINQDQQAGTYTEEEYKLKGSNQNQIQNQAENTSDNSGNSNTYTEEQYKNTNQEISTTPAEENEPNSGTYTEDEYKLRQQINPEESQTQENIPAENQAEQNQAGTYTENEYKLRGAEVDENQTQNQAENINPEETQNQTEQAGPVSETQTQPETQVQTETQSNTTWEHKVDANGQPIEKFIAEGENPYELNTEQVLKINNLYEEKMNKLFTTASEKNNWNGTTDFEGIENRPGMATVLFQGATEKGVTPVKDYIKITSLIKEIHDKTGLKPIERSILENGTSPKEYIIKGMQYAEKNNIKLKL